MSIYRDMKIGSIFYFCIFFHIFNTLKYITNNYIFPFKVKYQKVSLLYFECKCLNDDRFLQIYLFSFHIAVWCIIVGAIWWFIFQKVSSNPFQVKISCLAAQLGKDYFCFTEEMKRGKINVKYFVTSFLMHLDTFQILKILWR